MTARQEAALLGVAQVIDAGDILGRHAADVEKRVALGCGAIGGDRLALTSRKFQERSE